MTGTEENSFGKDLPMDVATQDGASTLTPQLAPFCGLAGAAARIAATPARKVLSNLDFQRLKHVRVADITIVNRTVSAGRFIAEAQLNELPVTHARER